MAPAISSYSFFSQEHQGSLTLHPRHPSQHHGPHTSLDLFLSWSTYPPFKCCTCFASQNASVVVRGHWPSNHVFDFGSRSNTFLGPSAEWRYGNESPRSSIAIIFFGRFARFVPKGFFVRKLGATYNFQPLYSYTLQRLLFDRQGKTSENIFLLKGMNPCILKISCTQKATNIQFYSKVLFKASCPTASMQILIVHAVSYLSSASAICEKVKVSLIFYIRDVILTATNLT